MNFRAMPGFEEMRKRLKESAEEKIILDKENKELISNISHDLKNAYYGCKRDMWKESWMVWQILRKRWIVM